MIFVRNKTSEEARDPAQTRAHQLICGRAQGLGPSTAPPGRAPTDNRKKGKITPVMRKMTQVENITETGNRLYIFLPGTNFKKQQNFGKQSEREYLNCDFRLRGRRESTVGRELALQGTNPSNPSPARTVSETEPGGSPEHHEVWLPKNKATKHMRLNTSEAAAGEMAQQARLLPGKCQTQFIPQHHIRSTQPCQE